METGARFIGEWHVKNDTPAGAVSHTGTHAVPDAFLSALLEILFPGRCLVCGEWMPFPPGTLAPVCPDCATSLTPLGGLLCGRCGMPMVSEEATCCRCRGMEYAFLSHRSVFPYSGTVRDLMAHYKIRGRRRLAFLFAPLLAGLLSSAYPGWTVVPVPPRPGRGRMDGVERIARMLEKRHGVPVRRLLERSAGAAQKTLDFAARQRNLRGRIRVRPGMGRLPGRVVLLDDVFTTGATMDTCARALLAAGVGEVHAASLAIDL
jgi:competence protein ComFC